MGEKHDYLRSVFGGKTILVGNLILGRKQTIFVAHFLRQNTQFRGKTISNTIFWGESPIFWRKHMVLGEKKVWGLFFGGKHPCWGPFFSLCTHCLGVTPNFVGEKTIFRLILQGVAPNLGPILWGEEAIFGGRWGTQMHLWGKQGHPNISPGCPRAPTTPQKPKGPLWAPQSTQGTPKLQRHLNPHEHPKNSPQAPQTFRGTP